ncbi:hypothetical protein KSF_006080 [Reticulibacter mediterranei]|uniref:Uncharacterized protein n=1 Tax=Reticulibacter mediterranei TaxID=2778369 RepID=A0A8J3IDQ1_9CHLR|nr:hypothetical protein [Reticulibacter mediterranei]GHO90560.1 hypothetical protein KSF_006080 [Reticulibacter mediterranei]
MTSILMVPIHLDALLLKQDQLLAAAMADFSRLPYSNHVQDVNAAVANISEDVLSPPFEDQNLYVKAGIHLHWALPDTLTRGKHTADGTDFPAVPNRWLVVRSRREAGKQESIEKAWVVESDYLYPDGVAAGSISIPFSPTPAQGKYRPFRYQGRSVPLEQWQAQDTQAEYLEKLTAVGYGEPTFAAFYPNCHSVFGLYDGDVAELSDGLQYDVIGWYSQPAQDYLALFVRDVIAAAKGVMPGVEALQAAIAEQLRWTVALQSDQEFPQQTICYARLNFDLSSQHPDDETTSTITVAVGNTGTEALSAYLASTIDATQKAVIEDQLEALQLADRLAHRQLDIGAKFVQARHEKGFAALQGGSLWTIKADTDPSASADAPMTQEQLAIVLPDDMAQVLNRLNLLQRSYDQSMQNIACMRKQLFADWYKYMLSTYPPDDAREDYPDIDEIRYFIEGRDLMPLQQTMDAAGQLSFTADGVPISSGASSSLAAQLVQAINDLLGMLAIFNASDAIKKAKMTYTLKQMPAPRYWQPAEPVLLLLGPVVQPNERHGQDGLLACQILPDATVQDLLPRQFATIRAMIDKSSGEEGAAGFNTWTRQPWNPFLLEWVVEVFPLNDQGNLHPETEEYQQGFITSNYTLPENQPDLSPLPARTLVKAANVYSGTSILTSYAQSNLKELVAAYVQDPQVDTTTDTYRQIKAAYDLLSASNFYSLSQALSGFNEALLMHKQTRQLALSDPLGFDDYQVFTQSVGNDVQWENKSAPQPLWDFNPIRSGAMSILRLRLVDTFGQVRDLDWSNIITTEQMSDPQSANRVMLPPRLMQPSCLNFRWLTAATDEQEMNDHPATTPICGWVLPNNLDNSLLIYDNQGKILGIINQRAIWDSQAPGFPNMTVDAIANPHLRQMVRYLLNQGETFLSNFISVLDSGLANIDPENFAQHQDLALLIGRPIALVRASLSLELQGLPAIHQGWNNFRQDLRRTTRDTNGFSDVVFPIRLGEYQQLNDGLVGYWKEQGDGYADDMFYAPQSDPIADAHIKTHADHPAPLQQTLEAPPTIVSMLVDPRGSVHATCGILPVKGITIPPDQYATALQAIEVLFLSTPIVTDRGKINLPLPVEAGYSWSWAASGQTTEIGNVTLEATFSAQQEIREGWLKLSAAESSTQP